jgi:hypothetical protein
MRQLMQLWDSETWIFAIKPLSTRGMTVLYTNDFNHPECAVSIGGGYKLWHRFRR